MTVWIVLLGIGAITYATRLSFIMFFRKVAIPPVVLSLLHFVPVAVLSAIIWPQLFLSGNSIDVSPANPRLIAGLLAALIAWRTRNVLLTIVVGMIALWILQWLL